MMTMKGGKNMARGFDYFACVRITEDVPELFSVMQKWKTRMDECRKEWEEGTPYSMGKWPAKLVETRFVYKGQPYHCFPDDIGLERGNCWDEGLMEYLQMDIQKDLEAAGATDVSNIGFGD